MVRLTRLSLAHRTVVLLLGLLTIGMGVYAAGALKQEMIPSIDVPQAAIMTVYAGAAPDVVEAQVSKPIESAVKSVPGVTSVTSRSSSAFSQVTVEWDYGLDVDEMSNKLRSAVDSIAATLPANSDPRVVTGGTDDIPIMVLALSSDADLAQLSSKVTEEVAPELRALPGVREVSVAGQEEREIVITYSRDRVDRYGIDPTTIAGFFAAGSNAFPSGTMHTSTVNYDVQTGKSLTSAEQIGKLMVYGTDGPVALNKIATVKEQPVESTSVSRVNGKTSLTMIITKTPNANTVTVAKEVNDALPELATQVGGAAEFAVVFDQAPYITDSIHDLSVEGGIGLGMAVLVILVFLGSVRPTIITAISIPLSLLIALVALLVGGYTLNILTLAALTVAVGRVVDDSIVVIENIKRHQSYGEYGRERIIGAVKEVAGAVTSSTLTTVAVFLPIGLVGGQAGEIFQPFAVAVTVALLASLLVSLTVVPVLASWFMRPTAKQAAKIEAAAESEETTTTWLQRSYLPILNWALHRRWITLAIALGIFAGTLALAPNLKTDFIGDMGTASLTISQKLPAGTGLTETDAAAKKVEELLSEDSTVQAYSTTIGGSNGMFMGQSETNSASFNVPLAPGTTAADTAARLRAKIAELGSEVGVVEVSIGAAAASGVRLFVEGSDPKALQAVNDQVLEMMKGVHGLTNVTSDLTDAKDMLQIDVNDKVAAKHGMTQASIGQAVAQAVRGQMIGTVAQGDTSLNVYLRSQNPVKNIEELRKSTLPVTQVMNGNAKKDAAEAVTKDSDKFADDAKADATKAYNDQVKALKKSRAEAQKATRTLSKQVKATKKKLASLQKKLAAVPKKCADPANQFEPDCLPIPGGVFALSQQISATAAALAQLSGAQASAKSGITAVDKQLDGLVEGRRASLDAQERQQDLADRGKDAQEATAAPLPLSAVASVSVVKAPVMITRVGGTRAATLSASSESSDLGAVTADLQAGVDSLQLPEGVTVRIGGVSQEQQESFGQLGLAMLIAIAVVYLIMVATFGSLLQPLVLLVSIPFAATGALGLSLITDTPLGVPSMIGLLMLIGIVVTNAIVLIDLINQKRKSGLGVDESIQAGARLRVRPIIMTALATVFALVPMSLGLTGGGVFISKPLAIVVIGGLLSSTLLTLILVPVLYDLLETWREKRAGKKAARRAARQAAAAAPTEA